MYRTIHSRTYRPSSSIAHTAYSIVCVYVLGKHTPYNSPRSQINRMLIVGPGPPKGVDASPISSSPLYIYIYVYTAIIIWRGRPFTWQISVLDLGSKIYSAERIIALFTSPRFFGRCPRPLLASLFLRPNEIGEAIPSSVFIFTTDDETTTKSH